MPVLDLREKPTPEEEPEEVKETETEEESEESVGEKSEAETSTAETSEDEKSDEVEEEKTETEDSEASSSDGKEDDVDENVLVALRAEREKILSDIRELRKERREAKYDGTEKPVFVDKAKEEDGLKDVNPQDVELIEKVLRSKGYVHKSELQTMTYQQQVDRFKDEWLEAHPEYKPENDPDDKKWGQLNETIRSYFKAPTKASDIKKVLDLAHAMVNPSSSLPIKTRTESSVAKEKISVSSKGAGGGAKSVPAKSEKIGVRKEYLKGFTDEEIAEMYS